MRRLIMVAVLAATFAPQAAADGLPVLGVDDGSSGVTLPGAASRYVTIPSTGGTLVERINRNGGQVLASAPFPGNFTIPAVAYDGTAGGLSADGHTLALIEPRQGFPRIATKLLVLHVPSLRYQATVKLSGDFSFDAISPNGRRLYLIQYLSPIDPTRYAVRRFDVRSLTLDSKRIVDPANPRERMRGNPLSRVASPDGRWAFTLYDGGGGTPFVHALDTAGGAARCIDLDGLDLQAVARLHLTLARGGRSIHVADGAKTVLAVNVRTLRVSAPHAPSHRRTIVIAGLAALLLAFVVIALGSTRGRNRGRAAWRTALRRAHSATAEATRD